MSALTDGASRRQAFLWVVLPQVRNGLLAVAVFTFIRGWEEYIFVWLECDENDENDTEERVLVDRLGKRRRLARGSELAFSRAENS